MFMWYNPYLYRGNCRIITILIHNDKVSLGGGFKQDSNLRSYTMVTRVCICEFNFITTLTDN